MTLRDQLALKMKLEERFKPEIRRVFFSMLQDFKATVAATGQPLDAQRYRGAWESVINNHYRRTQKAFTGVSVDEKRFHVKQDENTDEELLLLALLRWREQNTPDSAQAITRTNTNNQNDSIRMARNQFADEDIIPTNTELALASTVILKRKYSGRVETISVTETQAASESTKFIEAEISSGLTPRILGGSAAVVTTRKKWIDADDKRVRPWHNDSRISIQLITDPFIVKGELLMHPGDRSLGAGLSNTANCRCLSDYLF